MPNYSKTYINRKNILLSICIPTYNRQSYLSQLLKNIENNCSSHKEIEVVIIDDGSTDNTDNYIHSCINYYNYPLCYYKKENGGKLSAVRFGLEMVSGKYFMDMDTDDLFPLMGIDTIVEEIKVLEKNKSLPVNELPVVGVVGLAYDKNNILIGTNFPQDSIVTNLAKIRADYKVKGDKKEIVLTEYLRKIKIDIYPGEKRYPTSIIWLKLSAFTQVKFVNKQFIIKDYLQDGITSHMLRNRINSPNNILAVYKEILELDNYSSIIYRFRASINYWRFRFHGAQIQRIKFPKTYFCFVHSLLMPIGCVYALIDKINLKIML